MPQRDRNTGYKAKKLLAGTLAMFMFLQQASTTVFAVDTELSANTGNYQTIDENTSLLHTAEITNTKLKGCNFDITVILNDGELVSVKDSEILEHVSFTTDEGGILTIDTQHSVVISNVLDKANHRIVIKNAKDVTFNGVYLKSLAKNSNKPILDVLTNTTIILDNNSNNSGTTVGNVLEINSNFQAPAINGIDKITLVGDGKLTVFSSEVDASSYEKLQQQSSNFTVKLLPSINNINASQTVPSLDELQEEIEEVIMLMDEISKEEAYWNEVGLQELEPVDSEINSEINSNEITEELETEENFVEEFDVTQYTSLESIIKDYTAVNSTETNYLPNCRFYVYVDLGDGEIVDNYDKKILAYVGFDNYIDTGVLTIKTTKPVTISNKYGVIEEVEHSIVIAEGLDECANLVLNGVNIISSTLENVPVLNLKSNTVLTVKNISFENKSNYNNTIAISKNNYHGLTVEGFENLVEVNGGGNLVICSSVYDRNDYLSLSKNITSVKVTKENLEIIESIYNARTDMVNTLFSEEEISTSNKYEIYSSLPVSTALPENTSNNTENDTYENTEINTEVDSHNTFNIDDMDNNDLTNETEPSLNDRFTIVDVSQDNPINAAVSLTSIKDDIIKETTAVTDNQRHLIRQLGITDINEKVSIKNSKDDVFADTSNAISTLAFSYDLEDTKNFAEPVFFNSLNGVTYNNSNTDINMQLSPSVLKNLLFGDLSFLFGNKNISYSDIEKEDGLYEYIQTIALHNIELGMTDNIFYADSDISRATIVSAIYSMESTPKVKFSEVFEDIEEDDRNADAVVWAAENELIFGIGDNLFAPYDIVTYEEIIAILHRYAIYKDVDNDIRSDIEGFTDFEITSNYAIENLKWAVGNNLIEGTADNYLQPNKEATRGEAAMIISKYIDLCF